MTVERVDVEVVGRLVEQQHVGFVEQQPQELQPAPLAAGQVGQPRGQLVADEPEVLQQCVGADLAAARERCDAAPVLDGVDHPIGSVHLGQCLAQVADLEGGAALDGAGGGLQFARRAAAAPTSCRCR